MFAAFAVGGGLLVSVGEAGAAFGGERFGKGGEILLQITVHAPFYALVRRGVGLKAVAHGLYLVGVIA